MGEFKIGPRERAALLEVIESNRISEGSKVREFEHAFAEKLGRRFVIAVNSGTSALIAALSALKHENRFGLRGRPKVLTTPLTYVATINAIVLSGFEPVFVDVDRNTYGLLPDQVYSAVRGDPSIGCILPVHLMGYPCAMEELLDIADRHDLVLLEDAAQAHGSVYHGKVLGSWGDASTFSFYIAHNIQAGELGAVATDDSVLARTLRRLKSNGRLCDCEVCTRRLGPCLYADHANTVDGDPRFTHIMVGYNFRAMEFQAAIAAVQLQDLAEIKRRRFENVRRLREGLAGLEDVFVLPELNPDVSYLAFPITIRSESGIARQRVRRLLEARGVETRPLFGCIPTQQPAYRHMRSRYLGLLPNAEYLGAHSFYIGCHQFLSSDDIDFTVEAITRVVRVLQSEAATPAT